MPPNTTNILTTFTSSCMEKKCALFLCTPLVGMCEYKTSFGNAITRNNHSFFLCACATCRPIRARDAHVVVIAQTWANLRTSLSTASRTVRSLSTTHAVAAAEPVIWKALVHAPFPCRRHPRRKSAPHLNATSQVPHHTHDDLQPNKGEEGVVEMKNGVRHAERQATCRACARVCERCVDTMRSANARINSVSCKRAWVRSSARCVVKRITFATWSRALLSECVHGKIARIRVHMESTQSTKHMDVASRHGVVISLRAWIHCTTWKP